MENYNFDIQEELKKLPAKPGVYIMHDEKDAISKSSYIYSELQSDKLRKNTVSEISNN